MLSYNQYMGVAKSILRQWQTTSKRFVVVIRHVSSSISCLKSPGKVLINISPKVTS